VEYEFYFLIVREPIVYGEYILTKSWCKLRPFHIPIKWEHIGFNNQNKIGDLCSKMIV
jgi:hypothetical protein